MDTLANLVQIWQVIWRENMQQQCEQFGRKELGREPSIFLDGSKRASNRRTQARRKMFSSGSHDSSHLTGAHCFCLFRPMQTQRGPRLRWNINWTFCLAPVGRYLKSSLHRRSFDGKLLLFD